MKLSRTLFPVLLLGSFATPAFAYLDPGAGSFVLQMLIAGIMGAMFTIKLYWYRLKSFIAGLFGKTIDNPMESSDEESQKDSSEEESGR